MNYLFKAHCGNYVHKAWKDRDFVNFKSVPCNPDIGCRGCYNIKGELNGMTTRIRKSSILNYIKTGKTKSPILKMYQVKEVKGIVKRFKLL